MNMAIYTIEDGPLYWIIIVDTVIVAVTIVIIYFAAKRR